MSHVVHLESNRDVRMKGLVSHTEQLNHSPAAVRRATDFNWGNETTISE